MEMSVKSNWKEFAEEISDKVASALDYWCQNVSGDPVEDCYAAHSNLDLYDLAQEFAGWSRFGITEEDLKLLEEMPDDVYEEYSERLKSRIEEVARKLSSSGADETDE